MAYTKVQWRNNQSPPINADNLNHIENGIYEAHQTMAENTQSIESLTTQTGANASAIALEKTQRQQADTAEMLAREQADTLLSNRMDTFTRLPDGSTSGDAELIDIRNGANGVIYPQAGDAVRGQYSDLKNAINELFLPLISESNVPCNYTNGIFVFEEQASAFPYAFFNRDEAVFSQPSVDPNGSWIILCEYENGVLIGNMHSTGGGYYISYDLSVITPVQLSIILRGFDVFAKVTDSGFTLSANGTTVAHTYSEFTSLIDDTFVGYRLGYARQNQDYAYSIPIEFSIPANDFENRIEALEDSENAITNNNVTIGGVIGLNGEIITHNGFGYTDFIEVPKWANTMLFLNKVTFGTDDYSLKDYEYAVYNSSKQFIETIHGDTTIGYIQKSIDSESISYVRVNFGKQNYQADECVIKFSHLEEPTTIKSPWNDKIGDFLGDSLTAQGYYTGAFHNLYGITVNNYGESGTTISNINTSNMFYTRIANMSTSCDFVFVMGGTNDWGLGAPLGSADVLTDNDYSNFYSALYNTFALLRQRFPSKPIFVSTITPRNWQGGGQASGIFNNGNGVTLMQFNDAVRYIAGIFGCHIIDGFASGINLYDLSTYTADNLHFNSVGGVRFATYCMDMMKQITPY